MPTSITLPALGESVTEGTVVRWLKAVGDEVAFDEPLLEVATDKVDTEIPAPVAGRLTEIIVGEDETVPVGTRLAVIEDGSGVPEAAAPEAAAPVAAVPERPRVASDVPSAPVPLAVVPEERSISSFVTPLVRKLADEHGIDLSTVVGNGVGGRIRKHDVLAAVAARQVQVPPAPREQSRGIDSPVAEQSTSTPTLATEVPHDGIGIEALAANTVPDSANGSMPAAGITERLSPRRKVIAARMVESLQVSAQLTSVVEVDVTPISRHREANKENFAARHGIALSYLPYFAKATLEALKEHRRLNASIDTAAGEVTYHDREHLAIAVDTDGGLLTPVLRDAGDLSVTGLARNIADLAHRARTKKIGPDELTGGTFTLTNTGSRGSLFDTPIINQPQVAVLGTGAVVKRVAVIDDPDLGETIVVRRMMYLSLTYDHRLVDGADAARFLTDVRERLETGSIML